jgi:hypothetical protein
MSTPAQIAKRAALTAPQIAAIIREAEAAGAHAAPVHRRDGSIDEIALFYAGENLGTAFRPSDAGGLAVWVSTGRQRRVSNAASAVRAIFEPIGGVPAMAVVA